jgi:hypothetical protein
MPEKLYDSLAVACSQASEKLQKGNLFPTASEFASDSVDLSI